MRGTHVALCDDLQVATKACEAAALDFVPYALHRRSTPSLALEAENSCLVPPPEPRYKTSVSKLLTEVHLLRSHAPRAINNFLTRWQGGRILVGKTSTRRMSSWSAARASLIDGTAEYISEHALVSSPPSRAVDRSSSVNDGTMNSDLVFLRWVMPAPTVVLRLLPSRPLSSHILHVCTTAEGMAGCREGRDSGPHP
ncbi:hypothetical protein EJ03DRAFT_118768 [Teratosphaeria nubilosa]|uniref:Uncharacterized protein n=1 Tax=Teratosphaeria nubilosa TaxID=161662 RepID=A0A6G1L6D9_9PEZI|nr:hypothetical protein EJ03DRAFT_118768 [Teratosphaeria nubilosa]